MIERNDAVLKLTLAALKQVLPGGAFQDIPIKDRIGAMLLLRITAYNTDSDELVEWCKILVNMIGSTTGLRPPAKSLVELHDQLN
jgi:hypothetical protein